MRAKSFALVIKSSLFEGIFVHAKGVNCTNLEIEGAKNIQLEFMGNDSRRTDRHINSSTFQNLLCMTFVNKVKVILFIKNGNLNRT